jgi:ubiquinone/menaquinone biosynthesis C-methylase UbiE
MASKTHISRVTRSKQQAMAAYDRLSRWYDGLSASSEQPLVNLGLDQLNAGAGQAVLEIGCGTGHALVELASKVGDSGKVHAVDLSRGMLALASKRISRSNLAHRTALAQADALNLPFKTNCFDAAFMSFTLELFDSPEIPNVLAECRRVLKPDGRICVVALVRDEQENLTQQVYEWFHARLPAAVDCRPIFLQSALTQAGFRIQDVIRKMMWGLPVDICLAHNPGVEA